MYERGIKYPKARSAKALKAHLICTEWLALPHSFLSHVVVQGSGSRVQALILRAGPGAACQARHGGDKAEGFPSPARAASPSPEPAQGQARSTPPTPQPLRFAAGY